MSSLDSVTPSAFTALRHHQATGLNVSHQWSGMMWPYPGLVTLDPHLFRQLIKQFHCYSWTLNVEFIVCDMMDDLLGKFI